jgi:hypothetical protein
VTAIMNSIIEVTILNVFDGTARPAIVCPLLNLRTVSNRFNDNKEMIITNKRL